MPVATELAKLFWLAAELSGLLLPLLLLALLPPCLPLQENCKTFNQNTHVSPGAKESTIMSKHKWYTNGTDLRLVGRGANRWWTAGWSEPRRVM
jgi:hypothetical protein